jgi:hypothetical protein
MQPRCDVRGPGIGDVEPETEQCPLFGIGIGIGARKLAPHNEGMEAQGVEAVAVERGAAVMLTNWGGVLYAHRTRFLLVEGSG